MMTNEIINLVKQVAGPAIINNPAVPNEKNESAISSVAEGVMGGLKNEATGGGLGKLINMFSSGTVNNSISQTVETYVTNSVMDKIGLTNSIARQIAASVVPLVLSKMVGKTKNPNDSTTGAGILSTLTGRKDVDFQSLVDKGIGQADGQFNLSDALKMVGRSDAHSFSDTVKEKSEELKDKSEGLLGKIEGFFGKK